MITDQGIDIETGPAMSESGPRITSTRNPLGACEKCRGALCVAQRVPPGETRQRSVVTCEACGHMMPLHAATAGWDAPPPPTRDPVFEPGFHPAKHSDALRALEAKLQAQGDKVLALLAAVAELVRAGSEQQKRIDFLVASLTNHEAPPASVRHKGHKAG